MSEAQKLLSTSKNKKTQQNPSFFPVKKTNIPCFMINAGVEDEMNKSVTVCSRGQQGLPHAGKL